MVRSEAAEILNRRVAIVEFRLEIVLVKINLVLRTLDFLDYRAREIGDQILGEGECDGPGFGSGFCGAGRFGSLGHDAS